MKKFYGTAQQQTLSTVYASVASIEATAGGMV